jgi:hypothetical protein
MSTHTAHTAHTTHMSTHSAHTDDLSSNTLPDFLLEILSGFESRDQAINFLKTNKLAKHIDISKFNTHFWTLELHQRLAEHNICPIEFTSLMEEFGLKLTGSFLLQVIEGSKYFKYDIDLYVDKITPELILAIETKFNVKSISVMPTHKLATKGMTDSIESKYMSQLVDKIVNFKVPLEHNTHMFNTTYIQLIETTQAYKGIEKYIDTFDFDILQNYYDGNKFYVKNIDSINKKIAIYNEQFLGVRPFSWIVRRIKKYHGRGYQIFFGTNFLTFATKTIVRSDDNNHLIEHLEKSKNYTNMSGLEYLLTHILVKM